MRITRNTEHRLIFEDRPILISFLLGSFFLGTLIAAIFSFVAGEILVALFFSVFTALLVVALFLFVRRVQVIFDRLATTLTFRSQNLLGYREIVHPLNDLSHAKTEGYDTARCVLVFHKGMSKGEHPLTAYSTSGTAPQRITDAINAWLKDAAPVDSERTET
jgi:hypothetical protein